MSTNFECKNFSASSHFRTSMSCNYMPVALSAVLLAILPAGPATVPLMTFLPISRQLLERLSSHSSPDDFNDSSVTTSPTTSLTTSPTVSPTLRSPYGASDGSPNRLKQKHILHKIIR